MFLDFWDAWRYGETFLFQRGSYREELWLIAVGCRKDAAAPWNTQPHLRLLLRLGKASTPKVKPCVSMPD